MLLVKTLSLCLSYYKYFSSFSFDFIYDGFEVRMEDVLVLRSETLSELINSGNIQVYFPYKNFK